VNPTPPFGTKPTTQGVHFSASVGATADIDQAA
jgi:hypothetical protein